MWYLLRLVLIRLRAILFWIVWFFVLRYRGDQRINLGSGIDYRKGYLNVDQSARFRVDVHMSLLRFLRYCPDNVIKVVVVSHVINYLYFWELEELLGSLKRVLQDGGEVVIENPDVTLVIQDLENIDPCSFDYFERIRALFAFDMSELKNKEKYKPYCMAYRFKDIEFLASKYGFKIYREIPLIHAASYPRDLRIKLVK